MAQRAVAVLGALLAAALLAGCGSGASARPPAGTVRARTAIERGVLSSVRTAPGVGSVTSVHCAPRGDDGRRWSCRLAGARPQDVAVTVAENGWWSATNVRASAAPQMSADGAVSEGGAGATITGCCVPRP
jgi:hypothetical protein